MTNKVSLYTEEIFQHVYSELANTLNHQLDSEINNKDAVFECQSLAISRLFEYRIACASQELSIESYTVLVDAFLKEIKTGMIFHHSSLNGKQTLQ